MYSRSYYQGESGRVALPENYDGTAFMEAPSSEQEMMESFPANANLEQNPRQNEKEYIKASFGGSSLLSGLLGEGGLFGGLNLKMPKIGTEEILILATAAFLFFSKNGDKESALILLLLLLIN